MNFDSESVVPLKLAVLQTEEDLVRLPRPRVERHLATRTQVPGDSETAGEGGGVQVGGNGTAQHQCSSPVLVSARVAVLGHESSAGMRLSRGAETLILGPTLLGHQLLCSVMMCRPIDDRQLVA